MAEIHKKSPYGFHKFHCIDEYHQMAPEEAKSTLEQLRAIIHRAAPHLEECISYNMPAFKQEEVLVYYAAHKAHIGFYPTASPIVAFAKELTQFNCSKGAIQFPIGSKIPTALISKIVRYRMKEASAKALKKKEKHTIRKAKNPQ